MSGPLSLDEGTPAVRPHAISRPEETGTVFGLPESRGASSLIVVAPLNAWQSADLRELWRYRELSSQLFLRNARRRYRQTLLGPLWFVLAPLLRMGVFSLALGGIAGLPSEGVPYAIFTYTALLPWELFATGVARSTNSLAEYGHIISRVYFPRILLPITEVLTGVMEFGMSFGILLVMIILGGFPITLRILAIPLLIVLTMAISLAVGLFLAPLQVRFRDMSNLVSYAIQFWFLGTPVAYSAVVIADRLPTPLSFLYRLNPMNGVVEGFRWALLGAGRAPDSLLIAGGLVTGLLLFVGAGIFRKNAHAIVDMA
jgi:lipopolysaccharide transport system permease protein